MPESRASGRFVFPRWVNYLLPVAVLGAVGGGLYVPVLVGFGLSADTLATGYAPQQPIPFSHALHVGELGMDCRQCHTTVDQTDFAAIPSTQMCISCHSPDDASGIMKDNPDLRLLHESHASGEPIEWVKVHDLPDHAYFDHSAHVNRGVSCVSCHGRVDTMEVVYRAESMSMAWCLDCHREPEKHLRPVDEVYNLAWDPREHLLAHFEEYEARLSDPQREDPEALTRSEAQLVIGQAVREKYSIHDTQYMVSCSTCHR